MIEAYFLITHFFWGGGGWVGGKVWLLFQPVSRLKPYFEILLFVFVSAVNVNKFFFLRVL